MSIVSTGVKMAGLDGRGAPAAAASYNAGTGNTLVGGDPGWYRRPRSQRDHAEHPSDDDRPPGLRIRPDLIGSSERKTERT